MVKVAMVAGEASGDLLAAHLITALKRHLPQAAFCGIGGPKMQQEGFDAWWPAEKLAVRGYAEVLRHYREIAGVRRKLLKRLLAEKPDVFVAPVFGLTQWLVPVSFNLPPATVSPSKKEVSNVHSASPGTRQPVGQSLKVLTVYQLYKAP